MNQTLSNWQNTIKPFNELIIKATRVDLSDLLTQYPIGYFQEYINYNLDLKETQIGLHENLILCSFKFDTDFRRYSFPKNRKTIEKTITNNGFKNIIIPNKEYYKILPSYKFVISPEGQGLDTHRTYEALIAGCIPIVEENPYIKNIYGNCPILYTKDYSEITVEYLIKKYDEMKDNVYDFSKLLISNYSEELQYKIKNSSNFWCKKYLNKILYKDVIDRKIDEGKRLLFVHVNGKEYLKLYNLFVQTVRYGLNSNTDLLIITTEEYKNELEFINTLYEIKALFHITKYTSSLGKYSGKLDIVDWEFLNNYKQIIYTDIDILFLPSSIDTLFNTMKEINTIYVVPEKLHFTEPFFYHKEIYSETETKMLCSIGYVPGINTGIWGWNHYKDCRIINQLIQIRQNISEKSKQIQTSAAEQPYINHRFLIDGNFDYSFGYCTTLTPEEAVAQSYKNYKNNFSTPIALHYTYNNKYERMINHLPFILYLCSIYKQAIIKN